MRQIDCEYAPRLTHQRIIRLICPGREDANRYSLDAMKQALIIAHTHPMWKHKTDGFIYALGEPVDEQPYLEQLPVQWLSNQHAPVCAIPFDCYGIELGDVVEVEYIRCLPVARAVAVRSGYRVYRLLLTDLNQSERAALQTFLRSHNCLTEQRGELLAIAVPPAEDVSAVRDYLDSLEARTQAELFEEASARNLEFPTAEDLLWLPRSVYAHLRPARADRVDDFFWLWFPAEEGNSYDYEQIAARRVGDRLWEVCCIPFVAEHIALGDIVRGEGEGVVVEQPSGNGTLWVWSEQAVSEAMLQAVNVLQEQGYEWEWAPSHGLVISVARSEAVDTVEGLLSAAGWEHIRRVLL